jgi:hypothetical protein
MVGDGCSVCNPAKALEYARDTITDQAEEIQRLRDGLTAIMCEPLNAEYMAQNVLDGMPPYELKVKT